MKTAARIVSILFAASVVFGTGAQAAPVGEACGGAEGAVCDKGLWCEPPAGVCASGAGVCVAIPRFCIARRRSRSFKPVCGCNSKTYSSDCFRRAYKVGKSHDGRCAPVSAAVRGG